MNDIDMRTTSDWDKYTVSGIEKYDKPKLFFLCILPVKYNNNKIIKIYDCSLKYDNIYNRK